MVSIEAAKNLALALEEVIELPHFERTSFRVNKKIFATLDEKSGLLCVMLNPVDQSVFTAFDKTIIYPVPNKWGEKGATYVELKKIRRDMLKDILTVAYCGKASKKLSDKYKTI